MALIAAFIVNLSPQEQEQGREPSLAGTHAIGDLDKKPNVELTSNEPATNIPQDLVIQDVVTRKNDDRRATIADTSGRITDVEQEDLMPEPEKEGVAFLSDPDVKVARGKNGLMIYPEISRIKRAPLAGSVFEEEVFEVGSGLTSGDLIFTDNAKSAVEARMYLNIVRSFLKSDAQYLPIPASAAESLMIDILSIEAQGLHTVALVGKVKDRPLTQVRIVFHDGAVAGTIELYDEPTNYELGMAGDGVAAIRTIDMSENIDGVCHTCQGGKHCNHNHSLVDEVVANVEKSQSKLMSPVASSVQNSGVDFHIIDGVMGYNTNVKNGAGGTAAMEAKLLLAVGFINDALANSLITNTVVNLLGTVEEVNYSKGISATLADLNAGKLAANELWRTLGADYAASIYNGGGGVADLKGHFNVIGADGLNNSGDTVVHEFGHLLGCAHAWGDTEGTFGTSKFQSSYGWRFRDSTGARIRTVMSYGKGWSSRRIGHFSSPLVNFDGIPTGVVDGYDASGNSGIDPQLINGGAIGGLGSGYDGTNPELGADNRTEASNGLEELSNKNVRASSSVVQPVAESIYYIGEEELIYWLGGDHTQTAEIELYKGGVLHSPIDTVSNAHLRWYDWTVPDVAEGKDYSIKITLEGETPFFSEEFSIREVGAFSEDTSVIAIRQLPKEIALPDPPGITLAYNYAQPSQGTLTGVAPNLIYTSDAGVTSDSFTYSTEYGGVISETATVSITVVGPVAHWPLDDNSGTVVTDVSGQNHHGTLATGTWVNTGKIDGALEFNGGTDSVSLPASAFAGLDDEMMR